MSLLEPALELARAGVPVFPCGPDKSPRVAGGFYAATTDEDKIRSWDWNGGGMIGAPILPGQIVIDVDPRNGGEETMALLNIRHGVLPATRVVGTRSGGTHFYLTVPEDVKLRAHLGPGVDVKRAGKGYVIVPPSEGYLLESAGDPAPAPEWLLEELVVQERAGAAGAASDPKYFERIGETGTTYGLRALEAELGRLATAREGGRNDALNKAAFAMAQLATGGELDGDHAREELLRVGLMIGLEPDEAKKTIESGWVAGEQEPRQAPDAPVQTSHNKLEDREAEGRFWVDWDVEEGQPPFYLHPLLPKSAYVLVYGATEASKSMAWVGILAQGSRLGLKSSIYSLENPPHTDRDRLRRLGPDKHCLRLTNEQLDMNDPRQVEAMVRREQSFGTDVILIDTYSHAFNSRSDDGNAKAIEFAVRVRYVMHEVGCSVVVIDHTGYMQKDEPRDASAKRQQVDVAILMEKSGEWRPGQPARFRMENKKAARFANPFALTGEIRDTENRGLEIGWMAHAPEWRI